MQCQACTINTGTEFIEQQGYRCGGYILCGHCKRQLEKRGRVRLHQGTDKNFRLLYSDGTVKEAMKLSPPTRYKISSAQS